MTETTSADRPVLVTGATGFTGGALSHELRRRGQRVRALVRDPARAASLKDAGVEIVVGDITDAAAVSRAADGVRIIYHIAALFRTAGHPDSYYHDVNVRGTEHVLAAARAHGVERTVHCSTVGVHGHVSHIPSNEESPYNPGDVYQETKLEGEQKAQEAIAQGQPVSIVRPAGIYGPGDGRFLKLFKAIRNRMFIMFGSGKTNYHFTYIDDLVEGIILCGEHPAALGEIFIIGGQYLPLNDLVAIIADDLGVKRPRWRVPIMPLLVAAKVCEGICVPLRINPPLHTRRCEFFIKERAFTSEKAHRLLGYQPRIDVPEGMRRTGQWYRDQGWLTREAGRSGRSS